MKDTKVTKILIKRLKLAINQQRKEAKEEVSTSKLLLDPITRYFYSSIRIFIAKRV